MRKSIAKAVNLIHSQEDKFDQITDDIHESKKFLEDFFNFVLGEEGEGEGVRSDVISGYNLTKIKEIRNQLQTEIVDEVQSWVS